MNKDRKTYVEPNMKVVFMDPEEVMASQTGTGSTGGGEEAKPDFGSDENESVSGGAWKED